MTQSASDYRPDIDGLRALAVGSVLLFHAFPESVPGGFVGVDIFFVISGYLITSILVREAQQNRFSILRFYIRRARRIFPALVLVLGVTLLTGWLMLLPVEWRQLGKHVASGAAFVSNVTLWREVSYFDSSSELKPLLHLWSLAVEEQYYLVWPLVVHFAARRGLHALGVAAAVMALASLLACVLLTPLRPTEAFYLPFTRIWELLVGSGLAIATGRRPANATEPLLGRWAGLCSVVGVMAMLVAILAFDRQTPFPGIAAALPILGAALLIAAGPLATMNRVVFALRPMVWIGLISYPLYLWHWPVLTFARIWTAAQLSAGLGAAMLVLAGLLAWLTYRYAEGPIRDGRRNHRAGHDAAVLWLVMLAMGAIGLLAWTQHLQPRSTVSPAVARITTAQDDWQAIDDGSWPGGQDGVVLFVGDSHMQHYLPRIARVMQGRGSAAHTTRVLTRSGCAPIPGLDRRAVDCGSFLDHAAMAMHEADVRTVVLAGSWVGFTERGDYHRRGDPERRVVHPLDPAQAWVWDEWAVQLKALVASGKRVVVVLSSPRGPLVEPQRMIDRSWWSWQTTHMAPRSRTSLAQPVMAVDNRVRAVAAAAGAATIDPFDAVCVDAICRVVTAEGVPIFIDDSHFTASFVRQEVRFFDDLLLSR